MLTKTQYLLVALLCSFLLTAKQANSQQQAEEVQYFEKLAGEWEFQNQEGSNDCEMLGELTIHCHGTYTNNDGDPGELVFISRYDPEREAIQTHRFYSNGYSDSGLGWAKGDTLTLVYNTSSGNRLRLTNIVSGDTWTYRWHSSVKGGPWKPAGEGDTMKRVK